MKKLKKVSLQLSSSKSKRFLKALTGKVQSRRLETKNVWIKEEENVALYLSRTCFILVRPIFIAIIQRDISNGPDKNHLYWYVRGSYETYCHKCCECYSTRYENGLFFCVKVQQVILVLYRVCFRSNIFRTTSIQKQRNNFRLESSLILQQSFLIFNF